MKSSIGNDLITCCEALALFRPRIKSCLIYLQAPDLYLVDNALHPNLEKDVTAALGVIRKDDQGKSFEGWGCSKMLAYCHY